MNRSHFAHGALLVALWAACWVPASAKTLSSDEALTFQNCKGMSVDQAFRNKGCRLVFRKLRVTKSDLAKMQACESQASDDDCREMAEKHPDLARGHGMDAPGN